MQHDGVVKPGEMTSLAERAGYLQALRAGAKEFLTAPVVLEELRASKPGRALYTNVEFWSAVILEHAGVPRDLITPTFAVSPLSPDRACAMSTSCTCISGSPPRA